MPVGSHGLGWPCSRRTRIGKSSVKGTGSEEATPGYKVQRTQSHPDQLVAADLQAGGRGAQLLLGWQAAMPAPDRPEPRSQGQWNVSDLDRKLCLGRRGDGAGPSGTGEGPRGSCSEGQGGSMEGLRSRGVAATSAAPTLAGQWTSASVVSWRPGGGPDPHGEMHGGLCWRQGNCRGQAGPAGWPGAPSLACSRPIMCRSSRLS